jgi:ribosomal protein L37E
MKVKITKKDSMGFDEMYANFYRCPHCGGKSSIHIGCKYCPDCGVELTFTRGAIKEGKR